MLALFESLGGIELVVVAIAALLLFGKDLPKVASQAGAQVAKFKRTLDGTWRETGLEREVRGIRDATRDLSLSNVARKATEKLAVRLDEADMAQHPPPAAPNPAAPAAQPRAEGSVPRGAPDVAPGDAPPRTDPR